MSDANTVETEQGVGDTSLADALKVFPGAPTEANIEAWKEQHGEVFCSGFSPTELVIFRPMGRAEFGGMQTQMASSETPMTQLDIEEFVARQCVLWQTPQAEQALEKKAGSYTTLHEQIMQRSNFMDPRVAAQLVIRL